MAQLAPRQIFYILRVAELTLVTGFLNLFASGRAQQLEDPLGSRWAIVILLGILLALGLYGLIARDRGPVDAADAHARAKGRRRRRRGGRGGRRIVERASARSDASRS